MPCRYDDSSSHASCNAHSKELKKHLDELMQLLCSVCKYMEQSKINIPPDINNWWVRHQEEDRIREEQEKQTTKKDKILHLKSDIGWLLRDKNKIEERGGIPSQELLDKITDAQNKLKIMETEG